MPAPVPSVLSQCTAKATDCTVRVVLQAFFAIGGGAEEAKVREAHAKFLQTYSLAAADVPLLRLRPSQWDEPFVDL